MSLATIDFSEILHGSADERQTSAEALVSSLTSTGFARLTKHGIPLEMIQKTEVLNRAFFGLDRAEKMKCLNVPSANPQRGWSPKGAESTADLRSGGNKLLTDEKENFDIGPPDDDDYPNKWTEEALPGFQAFSEQLYRACQALCLQIMTAFEQVCKLPAGSMTERCKPASSELRYNFYPAVPVQRLVNGNTRRGWPHTDFGLITLLFQDCQGGLQYEDRSQPGCFLPLDRESPDEIAINISDTFERWTNGTIPAGVHRVWLPQNQDSNHAKRYEGELAIRTSTVFFFKANKDANVGALPEFVTDSRPSQYKDISALDFHKQMTSALVQGVATT